MHNIAKFVPAFILAAIILGLLVMKDGLLVADDDEKRTIRLIDLGSQSTIILLCLLICIPHYLKPYSISTCAIACILAVIAVILVVRPIVILLFDKVLKKEATLLIYIGPQSTIVLLCLLIGMSYYMKPPSILTYTIACILAVILVIRMIRHIQSKNNHETDK